MNNGLMKGSIAVMVFSLFKMTIALIKMLWHLGAAIFAIVTNIEIKKKP